MGLREGQGAEWRPSPARDQWLRASQSIPLNIAEGNGKTAGADRRRYFEIARGSALESAAIQDVLVVGKALDKTESQRRKDQLDRIAAMLRRLGGRGYQVQEEQAAYGEEGGDPDPDPDFDPDPDPDFDSDNDLDNDFDNDFDNDLDGKDREFQLSVPSDA